MSDKYLDKPGISELWTATKKYVEDHSTSATKEIVVNAPIGAILPWSGGADTVPDGWHICDGLDETVDLRDKFILGAGTKHKQGDTGGSEEVTLTVEQMPKHSHAVPTSGSGVTNWIIDAKRANAQSTATQSTEQSGNSQPHPNMPPYLTLYYIQKISETPTDYVTEKRAQEIAKTVLPADGEPGQVLTKTDDGAEWKDNEIYSLEETRIGTWIDGDPLYRIASKVTLPNSSTSATVLTLKSGINIKKIYGSMVRILSDGEYVYPIPYSSNVATVAIYTWDSRIRIEISGASKEAFYSIPAIIVVEYTKSSDNESQVKAALPAFEAASASDAPKQI